MNKDETIKEIKAIIVRHHSGLGCNVLCDGDQCENCEFTAEDIYNANYRKIADDEIVIKQTDYVELNKDFYDWKKEYDHNCLLRLEVFELEKQLENVRQDTARKILQELYDEAMRYSNEVVELTAFEIKQLAKEKGIELEG